MATTFRTWPGQKSKAQIYAHESGRSRARGPLFDVSSGALAVDWTRSKVEGGSDMGGRCYKCKLRSLPPMLTLLIITLNRNNCYLWSSTAIIYRIMMFVLIVQSALKIVVYYYCIQVLVTVPIDRHGS